MMTIPTTGLIERQFSRQVQKPIAITMDSFSMIAKEIQAPMLQETPMQWTRNVQMPAIISTEGLISRTALDKMTRTMTHEMTRTTTPSVPTIPFIPTSTFRIPALDLGGGGYGGESFGKVISRKKKTKYTPSFAASIFQIYGKRKPDITGMRLRPIPKGFRWW